jgi:hypothetical protein
MKKHFDSLIEYLSSRAISFVFLFSFFCLAYFFSPYWILPQAKVERIALIMTTFLGGGIWAILSAGIYHKKFNLKNTAQFIVFAVTIILLNFLPLNSSIPWRGDEEFHIIQTLGLINMVHPAWIIGGFLTIVISFILVKKNSKYGLWVWFIFLTILISLFIISRPINLSNVSGFTLLRYPYVNYWFISIIPSFASFFNHLYTEPTFRIIPIISVAGIVWVFTDEIRNKNVFIGWLWGIAIATIPLVFYYSSILYLEMPVILLMSVVFTRIETLFFKDSSNIKNDYGWIALILIGFLKETALIFLLCFLFFRWLFHFLSQNKHSIEIIDHSININKSTSNKRGAYLLGETNITFSILFPSLYFFFIRANFASINRQYSPSIKNLFDPSTYSVLSNSFFEQFGVFILLFFISIIYLIMKKNWFLIITYLGYFVILGVFFALDDWKYIGYSRFNLFILPIILTATTSLIGSLINKKGILIFLIGLMITTNLVFSPILSDGTKKPFWGNYNYDTSEHYYPYKEVVSFIKDTHIKPQILITGLFREYYIRFIFSKLDWRPKYDFLLSEAKRGNWDEISAVLAYASKNGYDNVIYHVIGTHTPEIYPLSESYKNKLFCNQAHCLILFYK